MTRYFLSHDADDTDIAGILADTLRGLSAGQIQVWYSSDQKPTGGIAPGTVWFDDLRKKLKGSDGLLALVTPRSKRRPWLHYEAGFAAASGTCPVIPICADISINDIGPPLGLYESYQLTDANSLRKLCAALLSAANLLYDEKVVKTVLRKSIRDVVRAVAATKEDSSNAANGSSEELEQGLRSYLDQKFFNLEQNVRAKDPTSLSLNSGDGYSIRIDLAFPRLDSSVILEIGPATTVQDVLDTIYFALDGQVKEYTYLQSWILAERETKMRLVIREVQSRIPAAHLFTPKSRWVAKPLRKPYVASDSNRKVSLSR